MKITVLGTRGEIEESAPYHSKKSGILLNDTVLLDIGDIKFLKYNPQYILITHLHPDHAYFVRHHRRPDIEVPVYAPEQYDSFEIRVTNEPFEIDNYTIIPIPTVHSLKVKSNAYLIAYEGKRVLYTGDMICIEKEYHHLLGNLDLVITEASFMREGGMVRRNEGKIYGHTGVPDLIDLFKDYTNKILFTHFGAWFYKNMSEARKDFNRLAKENNIDIIVGYDGLEIEI